MYQGRHQTPIKNIEFAPGQIWPTISQVTDPEESGVDGVKGGLTMGHGG